MARGMADLDFEGFDPDTLRLPLPGEEEDEGDSLLDGAGLGSEMEEEAAEPEAPSMPPSGAGKGAHAARTYDDGAPMEEDDEELIERLTAALGGVGEEELV